MKVTFSHPPVPGSSNPFNDFEPSNPTHYPTGSGIYIYGLKLEVDKIKKFVPLYVGIAINLRDRLYDQHYKQESLHINSDSRKEIFDFSKDSYNLNEIIERYCEILIYDLATNGPKGIVQQPMVFYLKFLIWFQDLALYNYKLGTNLFSGNSSHNKTIKSGGDLDSIMTAGKVKNLIIDTKKNFGINYYFVYTSIADIDILEDEPLAKKYPKYKNENSYNEGNKKLDGYSFSERVELATKRALNVIRINTTAKADGEIFDMEIDFSKIQDVLINPGGHPYNKSVGYLPNLIIPINK